MSSSSGVATSVSELLYPCYFTYFTLHCRTVRKVTSLENVDGQLISLRLHGTHLRRRSSIRVTVERAPGPRTRQSRVRGQLVVGRSLAARHPALAEVVRLCVGDVCQLTERDDADDRQGAAPDGSMPCSSAPVRHDDIRSLLFHFHTPTINRKHRRKTGRTATRPRF